MLPISIVVCTLDSQDTILQVVRALLKCEIEEVIIVDGQSSDATIPLVEGLGCKVIYDERRGLAAARNLGTKLAKSRFILFCGADNILNQQLVSEMYSALRSNKQLAGVGCRTRVERTGTLATMLDIQWSARVIAGDQAVLGTPSLFEKAIIDQYLFDETRTWSDDEELCQRIKSSSGKNFQIIENTCLEIGQSNLKRLFYRFKGYGRSDFEVYSANKNKWNLSRRFKSFLHPLDTELLKIFPRVSRLDFLIALPLLLFATLTRYLSWLSWVVKESRRSKQ